jgi:hypothetical protein
MVPLTCRSAALQQVMNVRFGPFGVFVSKDLTQFLAALIICGRTSIATYSNNRTATSTFVRGTSAAALTKSNKFITVFCRSFNLECSVDPPHEY